MIYFYKNVLTLKLNMDRDILENYADLQQRNKDAHVRKEYSEFEKELFEHIGYEIEDSIENDESNIIELNDYLSVKFEVVEQYGNTYEINIDQRRFNSVGVLGDFY